MNNDACRARPGWECECCSCVAEREGRDTDPAPPPSSRTALRSAAITVLDAWVDMCKQPGYNGDLFDFCESLL